MIMNVDFSTEKRGKILKRLFLVTQPRKSAPRGSRNVETTGALECMCSGCHASRSGLFLIRCDPLQSESFSQCSQLQMLCVSVLAHHTKWKNVCCQTIISYFCLSSISLLFQCCKRFLLFYIFLCLFVFPTVGAQRPDKHGIGWKTKRGGSQHMTSPIIKHFFVSLFAIVHAAEYAPISRHRAQGPFIPKGAQPSNASW